VASVPSKTDGAGALRPFPYQSLQQSLHVPSLCRHLAPVSLPLGDQFRNTDVALGTRKLAPRD